jgi:hypothetical protein
MHRRKILGIIAAITVFLGLGSLVLGAHYLGIEEDPIIRLIELFIYFVVALMVYYRIKGDESEIKEE